MSAKSGLAVHRGRNPRERAAVLRDGADHPQWCREPLGLGSRLEDRNPGLLGAVDAHHHDVFDRLVPGLHPFGEDVLVVLGFASRSPQISGTVTVGHLACAGSALLTDPRSRPTKPPRPRVPKTSSSAVSVISSRTPEASPFPRRRRRRCCSGHFVQRLLQDRLGPFADHRIIHRGVAAVQPGRGEDGHRVGGHDMQGTTPALGFAGRPNQGAVAVVRAVHADHDPRGACSPAASPAGSGCTCSRAMGSASSRYVALLRLFCQNCAGAGSTCPAGRFYQVFTDRSGGPGSPGTAAIRRLAPVRNRVKPRKIKLKSALFTAGNLGYPLRRC